MTQLTNGHAVFFENPGNSRFSYYEYKYLVPHSMLPRVRDMLDEFYGGSDPFPMGIVDSVYYDTSEEHFLGECLNGDASKVKFRIRGYGEEFNQVHMKIKNLSTVSKHKSMIQLVSAKGHSAPDWLALRPRKLDDREFDIIQIYSNQVGPLFPSIRVKYFRHRYRAYDYRITLDTNIEVSCLTNGLPRHTFLSHLPYHVLEIKTMQTRPKLPFVGMIKLAPVSFSKFMLGLFLLNE